MRLLFILVFFMILLIGYFFVENLSRQQILSASLNINLSDSFPKNEAGERLVNNNQPIHQIDFRKFTYLWCDSASLPKSKISLTDGELFTSRKLFTGETVRVVFSLENVYFQDFTSDGNDEALVTVTSVIEPNVADTCTYLFTLRQEKPEILWTHNNGDSEDRGVRKIYVEDNSLVVEEYLYTSNEEPTSRINPDTIHRLRYKWDGSDFAEISSEYYSNDQSDSPFLGYPQNKY